MASLRRVRADELSTMSAAEIKSMGYIFLEDNQTLSEKELADLRVRLYGLDRSQPVQLEAVDERLQAFADYDRQKADRLQRASSECLSLASTENPTDEQLILEEKEAYQALVQDGGQPSYPLDSIERVYRDPDGPDQYSQLATFWSGGDPSQVFHMQLNHWNDFRAFQDRQRTGRTPEQFEKYVKRVRKDREEKGLLGDIRLARNRKGQDRLEDWKEHQFYEYWTYDRIRKETEPERCRDPCWWIKPPSRPGSPVQRWKDAEDMRQKARESQKEYRKNMLGAQAFYVKWVDEQLPIIAAECKVSLVNGGKEHETPAQPTTETKKRKRSSIESREASRSPRKAPRTSLDETANGATASSTGVQDASDTTHEISREAEQHGGRTSSGSGVPDATTRTHDSSPEQEPPDAGTSSRSGVHGAGAIVHDSSPEQKPQGEQTLELGNTYGGKGQGPGLADNGTESVPEEVSASEPAPGGITAEHGPPELRSRLKTKSVSSAH